MNNAKRIVFGRHDSWQVPIMTAIDTGRFDATFGDLAEVELLAGYDAIVPLRCHHYTELERLRDHDRRLFLQPAPEQVRLAEDKRLFNRYLVANGFGEWTPRMYDDEAPFPYIYKKRRAEWGEFSTIVCDGEDARKFETTAKRSEYFRQAYVPGRTEYCTHVLSVNGDIRFCMTVEYRHAGDYHVRGRACEPQERNWLSNGVPDFVEKIVERLSYTGTCNFDYKMHNGVPQIFEMNPRFGASLAQKINEYLDHYLDALR